MKLILFLINSLVLITFLLHPIYAQNIAAGGRHSLLICKDSTVQSWGYNGFGQLGNGTTIEKHSGTKVLGLSGIVQVAGGLFHSLFVKEDGTVWSCGRNPLGPLGDDSNTDRHTPVRINALTNVIQVAGGGEHSLFLKNDHTVWACGANSSGQLGDGSNSNRNKPIELIGFTDVIQVAAGAEYSLFLKKNGSVWACGHNGYGQYGSGNNTSSKIPILINGLSDIIQITAGEWHSIFVKKDGTVYTSGRNNYGQLGNGTLVDNNLAKPILELTGISQAEAGGIHSVFVKNNGTVWSCGLNSGGNNDGQLGDGTTTDRNKPVQVLPSWGMQNIVYAEACREHSLYLSDSGEIWSSGRNNYGQLGIGSLTNNNFSTAVHATTLCLPLAVQSVDPKDLSILLSPFSNPISGSIQIHLNHPILDAKISLFNSLGLEVKQTNKNIIDVFHLDMENLTSGLYILVLRQYNKILYRDKIILSKK